MEEADYGNMPDFDAGESRFAPPDAVILSSLRIEPPFLLDFRKKTLVPAQEIACQCEKGSEVLRASVARAVRRHERKRASRALARGGVALIPHAPTPERSAPLVPDQSTGLDESPSSSAPIPPPQPRRVESAVDSAITSVRLTSSSPP